MVSSIGFDQTEIIANIIQLHLKGKPFEVDPTYSKGNFYKNGVVPEPKLKFDLYPQTPDTVEANANCLPLEDSSIGSLMFDPPFVAGFTREKPSGVIGERFHGFRYIPDLWQWYDSCLTEFYRILKPNGVLVVKCQDTVSSGKQWFSHVHLMNKASEIGFYQKDLFVLLAKSRIIGHNHQIQKHARKFHSYFLVMEKSK